MQNEKLLEILLAREERAARQKALLQTHRAPLVSFTMNIAGPQKVSPLIRYAFFCGLAALKRAVGVLLAEESGENAAGCYALLAVDLPAPRLKEICLVLEESEIGRLYDFDVLDTDGGKCTRAVPRRCLLCGEAAADCARSRNHGLAALTQETQRRLRKFAEESLADAAAAALENEARFTPKPGLVDAQNPGAHRDMDLNLMLISARALRPYFARFVRGGMEQLSPSALQAIGIEAENAMLAATGGVNTHKGALYSLALLLAACGRKLAGAGEDIFATAASIAAALPAATQTHGAKIRETYGRAGVRGEAVAGFATLRALLPLDDPAEVLLTSMARLDDSNLVYRGGEAGLALVKARAAEILNLPESRREAALVALDRELTARNLSPGGSADQLALWLFVKSRPMLF